MTEARVREIAAEEIIEVPLDCRSEDGYDVEFYGRHYDVAGLFKERQEVARDWVKMAELVDLGHANFLAQKEELDNIRAELKKHLAMNESETIIGGIRNLAHIAVMEKDNARILDGVNEAQRAEIERLRTALKDAPCYCHYDGPDAYSMKRVECSRCAALSTPLDSQKGK